MDMHSLIDYLAYTIKQNSEKDNVVALHILLEKFVTKSLINMDVLIFALIYFQLFTIRNNGAANFDHFISCVVVATKFLESQKRCLSKYARICAIPSHRMRELEKYILSTLDYHLNIPENIYSSTCHYLHLAMHENNSKTIRLHSGQ
eukprot:NODE_1253_length_1600_cov_0.791472.p2 type:complete len:147 gc:universal NODE_1253_length_1600_cov_0.791472:428-868(+)